MAEEKLTEANQQQTEEENPILVAQRYLNIYHQIHIFPPEKREEFAASLKSMPAPIRHILPSIPGGRALLDHILELEGIQKKDYAENTGLLQQEETQTSKSPESVVNVPVVASGKISLDPDFARNLAGSLATAFKNNNLMPGGNLNELSNVLSKSFNAYANNMQQMTETILSQNIEQLNRSQSELQEHIKTQLNMQNELQSKVAEQLNTQLNKQTELQNKVTEQLNNQLIKQGELQNKITEQVGEQISQVQNRLNTQIGKQLDWQNKMQSQFEQNMNLQNQLQQKIQSQITAQSASISAEAVPVGTIPHAAAQMNAQTNNANTTTINNINVDSSCFNGITQTLRETEEKRRADFQKIIEVLNKNFATNKNQKTQELPVSAITNSITEALRENSKQQLAAIKAFGETLSQTIRQSQQELAKTLSKTNSQPEKIYITQTAPTPVEKETSKSVQSQPQTKAEKRKDKTEQKSQNQQKKNAEQPLAQKTPKTDNQTQNKSKELPNPADKDLDFEKAFEIDNLKDEENISLDDIFANSLEPDLAKAFSEPTKKQPPLPEKKKSAEKLPNETQKTDDFLNAFTKTEPKSAPQKTKPQPQKPAEPEHKKDIKQEQPPKPKPHSHLYDDAMLKIKEALQSSETVALDDLDDVRPVSLVDNMPEPEPEQQEPTYIDTPLDDNFLNAFEGLEKENTDEWEYVDENDNPIEASDTDEWEYVDEDGTPVEASDTDEWEYVDENGNPVEASDTDEWEYVDENGNPVEASDTDEWEYVDENGNPVEAKDTDEWEYVDENGNPVEASDTNEWEYVDENGNPVAKDDELMNAFSENQTTSEKENKDDK